MKRNAVYARTFDVFAIRRHRTERSLMIRRTSRMRWRLHVNIGVTVAVIIVVVTSSEGCNEIMCAPKESGWRQHASAKHSAFPLLVTSGM